RHRRRDPRQQRIILTIRDVLVRDRRRHTRLADRQRRHARQRRRTVVRRRRTEHARRHVVAAHVLTHLPRQTRHAARQRTVVDRNVPVPRHHRRVVHQPRHRRRDPRQQRIILTIRDVLVRDRRRHTRLADRQRRHARQRRRTVVRRRRTEHARRHVVAAHVLTHLPRQTRHAARQRTVVDR